MDKRCSKSKEVAMFLFILFLLFVFFPVLLVAVYLILLVGWIFISTVFKSSR